MLIDGSVTGLRDAMSTSFPLHTFLCPARQLGYSLFLSNQPEIFTILPSRLPTYCGLGMHPTHDNDLHMKRLSESISARIGGEQGL